MRIIGIDLAVAADHRAIIADERGRFLSPVLKLRTRPADLAKVYEQACQGQGPDEPLVVVMEATDIVWYPVAVYFLQRGATVYLVNPRVAADLARFYQRHARSDRLAAKVLARLPVVNPDRLDPLVLAGAAGLALQRGCKELDRVMAQVSALKNRLRAADRLGWPDLPQRVFPDPFSAAARWFRDQYYDPQRVSAAGAAGLGQAWQAAAGYDGDEVWITPLVALAEDVQQMYGDAGSYLDYAALTAEVQRVQGRLAALEAEAHHVRLRVTRPRYRQLHAARHLETLRGVGQDSAAVYVGFVGDAARFANQRAFRGWSGLVPRSAQSGERESKGLRLTKAGPDLIKKYAYLDAEVARLWDPQLAALYYDQMVRKGKHHRQAVCACATHLLDRVRVILTEDRPYELRDVDGTPVTPAEARAIIQARYTVPAEVRQRNNRRARQERAERQAARAARKRQRTQ